MGAASDSITFDFRSLALGGYTYAKVLDMEDRYELTDVDVVSGIVLFYVLAFLMFC